MPLADLLSAIEAEAAEELERLDRRSREEAAAILGRARAEAAALETELAAAVEPAARAEAERIRAGARLEASATLRDAREGAFAATVDAVRVRLATIRESPRYPELLASLLEESRRVLPDAAVLRVDPRDEVLARELAGELRVEAVLESWGGLELAAEGRAVRNTLEHRLESAAPILRRRFASSIPAQAESEVLR